MKIWQLTFLESAYLKYENKLKLPLLPKMHSYLFSRPLSEDFVLTIEHLYQAIVSAMLEAGHRPTCSTRKRNVISRLLTGMKCLLRVTLKQEMLFACGVLMVVLNLGRYTS